MKVEGLQVGLRRVVVYRHVHERPVLLLNGRDRSLRAVRRVSLVGLKAALLGALGAEQGGGGALVLRAAVFLGEDDGLAARVARLRDLVVEEGYGLRLLQHVQQLHVVLVDLLAPLPLRDGGFYHATALQLVEGGLL